MSCVIHLLQELSKPMKPMTVDNIEVNIEDERWKALDIEMLAQRAGDATLKYFGVDHRHIEIGLLACNDARISELNTEFRKKPEPTNVLSWPTKERSRPGKHPKPPNTDPKGMPEELGDIAISYDTCVREAGEAGKIVEDHVTHLLVHGMLHLLGYDHIDDVDAGLMQGVEVEILGNLGISNPY